nr:hypothetical protein [uncultured Desulfobulbus sp.]
MNPKKLAVIGIAVVVAISLGLMLWPGDKRAIRKQVSQMEQLASKNQNEKTLDSLFRARKLAQLFQDPSVLAIQYADSNGEFSRKDIQDRILLARKTFTQVKVSAHDLNIRLTGKGYASLLGTLKIKGTGEGSDIGEVQELEAILQKVNGDWLFIQLSMRPLKR